MTRCLLTFVLLLIPILGSCIRKNNLKEFPRPFRKLRIAIPESVQINHEECQSDLCNGLRSFFMEGLTELRHTGTETQWVANLAEQIVNKSALEYSIQLRESARWSNGDPLLPAHFINAWRRNAKFMAGVVTLEQNGPKGIRVLFKKPEVGFPFLLSQPKFWPQRTDAQFEDITTGRFYAVHPNGSERIYRTNPYYASGPTNIDSLELRRSERPEVWVEWFIERSVDFVPHLPRAVSQKLNKLSGLKRYYSGREMVFVLPGGRTSAGVTIIPFLKKSLLRDELLATTGIPFSPATKLFEFLSPPIQPSTSTTLSSNTQSGRPSPLKLTYSSSGDESLKETASALCAQWSRTTREKCDVQSSSYLPNLTFIEHRFDSPWKKFDSLELPKTVEWERLQLKAEQTTTPQELNLSLSEIESYLAYQQSLVHPLLVETPSYLMSENVTGLYLNPGGTWNLRELHVD